MVATLCTALTVHESSIPPALTCPRVSPDFLWLSVHNMPAVSAQGNAAKLEKCFSDAVGVPKPFAKTVLVKGRLLLLNPQFLSSNSLDMAKIANHTGSTVGIARSGQRKIVHGVHLGKWKSIRID
ncbi:hypothetical protein M422DRAFT_253463 [Sphaerobolus stellatus SS14]|uniref:Unplaced genomic scaffold SPHSTscaffold_49, whole genome shotgun sequence n=1 Tax=Sphaerobolus stellatus (strain SS14) TaxID=990650 RepID=A0A0C9V8E4_SPHS4|nr:hypothetical protein M422DRAFT_253463 [Sphaerobolus stellatus SS14]